MTKYGIDWAWNGPTALQIHTDGDVVSCRYLSLDPSKNATHAEIAADLHDGVDVVLVWEAGAGNAGKGAAQGKTDGQLAVQQAKALGCPHGMTLYAAVDYDAVPSTVLPYFTAFASVVHAAGFDAGCYGSYRVCAYLLARKVVERAWQTAAWSGGKVLAGAALYQNARTKKIGGHTVDIDVVLRADYGGWKAAAAPHRAPVKPPVFVYRRPLRKGMVGADVTALKRRLRYLGYPSVPGPTFGSGLDASVRSFQRRHRLTVDGVVGPVTAKAVNA